MKLRRIWGVLLLAFVFSMGSWPALAQEDFDEGAEHMEETGKPGPGSHNKMMKKRAGAKKGAHHHKMGRKNKKGHKHKAAGKRAKMNKKMSKDKKKEEQSL